MKFDRPAQKVSGPRRRPARYRQLAGVLLVAATTGCGGDLAFIKGEQLLAEGKTGEAIRQMEQAVADNPGNLKYRAALIRLRDGSINRLLTDADEALRQGRSDDAERLYREALGLHGQSPRARAGLAQVELARREAPALKQAEALLRERQFGPAREKVRTVLAQNPDQAQAQALRDKIDRDAGQNDALAAPELGVDYQRPVSLEFRDAPLRTIFDAISRQTGLNFVFDKDIQGKAVTTISARNVAIANALDMLLAGNQLAKKVLGPNTLLIYPNRVDKRRDYEDMMVKGFFLANADAKQVLTLVKTMAHIRDVYVDEKLNAVIVRDTPSVVRMVEKLIRMADQPEPEVMLEVEVLEVKRTRLLELGVQWPTQFGVLTPEASTTSRVEGGVIVTDSTPGGRLTLDSLKRLGAGDIGVTPNPGITARKDNGDVNILANPRIRVRNKEKARIHVGEKVPVITSNTTSTGVVSESVSFLDVGLKLDVEPQVYLEGDVAIKVGMEVSNIAQEVRSNSGTLTYQLGSRNANTVLRLRDGETQALAGLISEEDRRGAGKVPGLGDIPLIGRLFSSNKDENSKTEIILLITPHIVRNVVRPELADSEFYAGTESMVSAQPMRMSPFGETGATATAQDTAPPAQDARPRPPNRGGFLIPRQNQSGGGDQDAPLLRQDDTEPAEDAAMDQPGMK